MVFDNVGLFFISLIVIGYFLNNEWIDNLNIFDLFINLCLLCR